MNKICAKSRWSSRNWSVDITLTVFAVLPVLGLVSGPAYAPMLFGLGVLTFGMKLWGRKDWSWDVGIFSVIACFVALGWLGLIWTIAPRNTLSASAQLTLISIGSFAAMAGLGNFPSDKSGILIRRTGQAFVFGAVLLGIDAIFGFQMIRTISNAAYKYNRGILYNLIIFWPILAFLIDKGEKKLAITMVAAAVIITFVGLNTSAKVSLVGAIPVLMIAFVFPRLIGPLLGGAISVVTLSMPFVLSIFTNRLPEVYPYVKLSGIHRLEIWDFLARYIVEHPLRGWGLWTSRVLPVTQESLGQYIIFDGFAVHPHNQWMQLWLETGFFGVICGLSLIGLMLRRIGTLKSNIRPYAYACLAMATITSFSNYEVTTDSWWAAIIAAVILFRIAPPPVPSTI